MKIIKIEDEKIKSFSKVNRKKIYFDNGTVIYLPWKIFHYFRLKKNMELEDEKFNQILDSIYKFEWSFTMKWLARRERSSGEVKDKLKERLVPIEIIDRIINKSLEYNFINDKRVSELFIKNYYEKGYGPSYIKLKLREKDLKWSASDLNIYDFYKNCKKIYEKNRKRYQGKKNAKVMLLNYLTRRGFPYEIIKEIVKGEENE
ncbi:regulatory protein RecX [bacterium]|nr:regulatory protein RecX [bacterium]